MQAATAFGKRKPVAVAPPLAPKPVVSPATDVKGPAVPAVAARKMDWPFLTLGLIGVLGLVYWAELRLGFDRGKGPAPGIGTLTALGGLDGMLVFQSGEWWRVFTAPLLHGSVSHYVGNAIALLFAGMILERLIGAPWFAALFVVSGLGGAAGSLALNPGKVISVGASGAIVGLLAAAFVCSFTFESVQLRRRMRKVSLRFRVPSLLPALLPLSTASSGAPVDYGAHIGGAVAGALMGFALSEIWPEASPRPALERLGSGIAMAGALAAAAAFALISVHYSEYRSYYTTHGSVLIPQSELPRNEHDGVARSLDLVDRYPRDPRGHLFRALYFLDRRNASDAERQLRLGLAEHEVLMTDLPAQVEKSLQLALAVVLVIERRKAEAKEIAAPVCEGAIPMEYVKLRKLLKDQGVCS
ncbi:MAG TPA: rhomboid family intramembrane serine protease [Micropepsaceae bacterium]|jgi:rhomboid protease GluP